jgi:hypothetical protein
VVADSLREKLIKIGAKVVSHGRYVTFQMAEVAVPRQVPRNPVAYRPAAGTTCAGVSGAGSDDATGDDGEGGLDAGKAKRFSASARQRGYFDRLLRTQAPICRCPRRPKGRF